VQPSGVSLCAEGRGFSAVARQAVAEAPVKTGTSYEVGQKLHGWTCVRSEYVKEFSCSGYLFQHDKTGAELMSMVQPADENKTFSVVFRTPPENSNGIAHVLEHSVLCGSRKYPLKEPFVELMKSSLQTFLNAMTFPDRTCYPVASCNLKDFYNLIDVYLDAVFHPRAINDPRVLAQEGWHYEVEKKDEPLKYKGVVFNEMKGVYSNPDAAHGRLANMSMFPDTQYGVDSGGDPREIPNLTFDYFKNFHGKFYHPSNAKFWFYGDDPADDRLELLDKFLSEFDKIEVDSKIVPQPLFKEPKTVVGEFAVGEDEDISKKTMIRRGKCVVGDSTALPFESACFDRYVSNLGCCCTSDLTAKLSEARRVLKPGGLAAMSMRIAEQEGDTSFALTARTLKPFGYPPQPDREGLRIGLDLELLRERLRSAGFEDVIAWRSWVSVPLQTLDDFMQWNLGQPPVRKFLDGLNEEQREQALAALRGAAAKPLAEGAVQIGVAVVSGRAGSAP
ncbi:PREP1, partial [Symbiodinium sp. CCMP2456]